MKIATSRQRGHESALPAKEAREARAKGRWPALAAVLLSASSGGPGPR